MSFRISIAATGLALIGVLACASAKVTSREKYEGRRLTRPDRILVYDVAATGAELPAWSEIRDRYAAPSRPRSATEIATGRELGALLATDLVAKISEMGLPAARTADPSAPALGDIALVGYFESIDDGSAARRAAIGFGTGATELKTRVEGYRMTDSGMRRIAAAEIESGDATPAAVAPFAVAIATANPIRLLAGARPDAPAPVGKAALEATAKRTADAIADELHREFARQGWL